MKKIVYLSLLGAFSFLCQVNQVQAQEIERRVSQYASVLQRIGVTDVKINYHRPAVKGREIWGKLVPYGYNYLGYGTSKAAPWRAGANESTTIEFSEDVIVEGNRLKAGKYGLFMAVFENNAVDLIFSNNASLWGSYDYKEAEDALRVKIKAEKGSFRELLTYEFEALKSNEVVISLIWESKKIPFKLIMTK